MILNRCRDHRSNSGKSAIIDLNAKKIKCIVVRVYKNLEECLVLLMSTMKYEFNVLLITWVEYG